MKRTLAVAASLVLLAGTAEGGGFLIYEHGAPATGMASARSAAAEDANCLYYVPAGITELDGLHVGLGFTGILPYTSYEAAKEDPDRFYTSHGVQVPVNDGQNDVDAKIHGFTPIHLYASYRFENAPLAVGFGLNNPFGLGTYWPGDWDGRFIGTETEIQTFFSQPVVALDVAELAGFKDKFKLSIAAGYNFVYATAHLVKRIDLRVGEAFWPDVDDPWGEMRLDGTATGHGWTASLYAELPDLVSFGATFRGGFGSNGRLGLPFSGDALFYFNQAGQRTVDGLGLKIPDKTGGEVTIDLPVNMNFGIAFLGIERLRLEVDFFLALFASYDELDLQFACLDEEGDARCDDLETDPIVKDWTSSWQLSFAAEYWVLDWLALRAGYGTVSSPVPDATYDPSLPDGRRDLICAGLGVKGSWWKADIGYMLAMWEGTKDNDVGIGDIINNNPEGKANGTYTTVSHLLGLTFEMWFLAD